MSFTPKFLLYSSDGITLVYTFPIVQMTNAPQSVKRNVIVEGIRGKGCIIIDGGETSWDLHIRGIFKADNYTDITTLIDALETAVPVQTKFVLKIERSISTVYQYNVIRTESIEYPESLRTDSQTYEVVFRVNAW